MAFGEPIFRSILLLENYIYLCSPFKKCNYTNYIHNFIFTYFISHFIIILILNKLTKYTNLYLIFHAHISIISRLILIENHLPLKEENVVLVCFHSICNTLQMSHTANHKNSLYYRRFIMCISLSTI